jgi:hypothetical protein
VSLSGEFASQDLLLLARCSFRVSKFMPDRDATDEWSLDGVAQGLSTRY